MRICSQLHRHTALGCTCQLAVVSRKEGVGGGTLNLVGNVAWFEQISLDESIGGGTVETRVKLFYFHYMGFLQNNNFNFQKNF